jgi:hypothetical protein
MPNDAMGRKREPGPGPEPSSAVPDKVCDVEKTEGPFGKRWHQEEVILSPEHVAALQGGRFLPWTWERSTWCS